MFEVLESGSGQLGFMDDLRMKAAVDSVQIVKAMQGTFQFTFTNRSWDLPAPVRLPEAAILLACWRGTIEQP